jgi:hypothetical protein
VKKTLVVCALLFLAESSFALEFRNTTWLMTKDEVVKSENGLFVSELSLPGQQQIVFRALVSGLPATITYILEHDKLISASLSFRRDVDHAAFNAMKQELVGRNGVPSFEKESLVGWRLERSEIALAHLRDGTTHVSYWEKSYFARINNLTEMGGTAKN